MGGSREPTSSRPLRRMAGTKGEQPSQRLRGGGTPRASGGPGRNGGRSAPAAPTPMRTSPSRSVPHRQQLCFVRPRTPVPPRRRPPAPGPLPGTPHAGGAGPSAGRTAAPRPSRPGPVPTHRASPAADAPPGSGAQRAGGGARRPRRGRRAPRGGTPRARAGWEDGRRTAHLARQLPAPVDPRSREGFDPRHNPPIGGQGGVGRTRRDPGVRLRWGRRGTGRPARVGRGQEVGLPSPGTGASSSNRVSTPGRRKGGRGGAGRVPAGTAARPGRGRWGTAGGRRQVEGPGRPWPGRRAPGLRPANGHPPPPLPPAAALASLPTPPPALQGTRDRFLPGPAAHQSRPSTDPFYDWGQGGERAGKSRGTV